MAIFLTFKGLSDKTIKIFMSFCTLKVGSKNSIQPKIMFPDRPFLAKMA